MAWWPLERERIYLDGGPRTTQLMRDSLGGGTMTQEELDQKRRKAAERMSASFMSNTKWRRALTALAKTNPGDRSLWKIITIPEPAPGSVPEADEIGEDYVKETATPGPLLYRDIEWMELVRDVRWRAYDHAPLTHRYQDLVAARKSLEAAGSFEITESEQGLRIHGYRV